MANLRENADALLSTTTVTFAATTAITLYTVPAGKRCVLTRCVVIASADATTATVTIGQVGALTDFLGTQTLSTLNAAKAAAELTPIPAATPVKRICYDAADIIQVDVTATGGGTAHIFKLFGILFDA